MVASTYAAITSSGCRIRAVAGDPEQNTVTFARVRDGHEVIVAAVEAVPLMFLSAVTAFGREWVVGKAWDTGHAIVVCDDGNWWTLGPTHGNHPAALAFDGATLRVVYVVPGGQTATHLFVDGGWGAPLLATIDDGPTNTSEGLLGAEPHGRPIFTNGTRFAPPGKSNDWYALPGGRWLRHPRRVGPWVIGADQEADRQLAWDGTQLLEVWAGYSPVFLGGAIVAGALMAAVSVPDVFVPASEMRPVEDPPPVPPDPPPSGSVCVAALPTKMWISPFYTGHSHLYPGPRDVIGNAVTLVGDERHPAVLIDELRETQDVPVICKAQQTIPHDLTNVVVAWWCSGANLLGLASHVAVARSLPEKAIWAYLDNRDWPTEKPAWMDDTVLPSVQCYVNADESIAEFEAAMRVVLDAVAGYGRPIVLTVQAFDRLRGQQGIDQALAAMPVIDRFCRDYPVAGLHFFADRRPGGMTQYPAVRAWCDAFQRANVTRPGRFDHWQPTDTDAQIRNVLGQTTPLKVFSPAMTARVLALLEDGHVPPDPTPPPGQPWANRLDVAEYVDARHPQLLQAARDTGDEHLRGAFVDQVAHELNRRDGTDRWGRKARVDGDPSTLNDDALTYRLTSPADKKLIDVVAGDDFLPAWDVRPAHEEPGNGYWYPPVHGDLG